MSTTPRHEQLLAAGWSYDPSTDRYAAPGSASDGTARQFNIDAAWDAEQRRQAADMPARGTRRADPRRQEPQ